MAVEVFCPSCGGKTSTRTSEEVTILVKKAKLVCRSCGRHSDFTGEITEHFDIALTPNTAIHQLINRPFAANDKGSDEQLQLPI